MKKIALVLGFVALAASAIVQPTEAAPKKAQASMSCTVDANTATRYVTVTASWNGLRVGSGYFLATKPDGSTFLDDAPWNLPRVTSSGSRSETLSFNSTSLFGIVTWKLYNGFGDTVAGGQLLASDFPGCAW